MIEGGGGVAIAMRLTVGMSAALGIPEEIVGPACEHFLRGEMGVAICWNTNDAHVRQKYRLYKF
jgi:hypothetical protein